MFSTTELNQWSTGFYVGQKDEADLIPYISFETERFEASLHDGLAFHALNDVEIGGGDARFSLVLTPRWEPDFGDDPLFDGLKRDMATEAGLRGRFKTGTLFFEAEALVDISGTHKGHEASAFAGVTFETGALEIEAGIGARHRSESLNQYLFGVSSTEVNASRAAFSAEKSTTGYASLTGIYALDSDMALVGDISFEDIGKMDASPLVNKSSSTSIALGLIFQF